MPWKSIVSVVGQPKSLSEPCRRHRPCHRAGETLPRCASLSSERYMRRCQLDGSGGLSGSVARLRERAGLDKAGAERFADLPPRAGLVVGLAAPNHDVRDHVSANPCIMRPLGVAFHDRRRPY